MIVEIYYFNTGELEKVKAVLVDITKDGSLIVTKENNMGFVVVDPREHNNKKEITIKPS